MSGQLRHRLERDLGVLSASGRMAFVMLNPSTATAETNDPTIRRCIGFARRELAGSLFVANLWALRSTDPAGLYFLHDRAPTEQEMAAWVEALEVDGPTVCAWGSGGGRGWLRQGIELRSQLLREIAQDLGVELWCLGRTTDGYPRHPLYVPKKQPLEPWK